MFDTETSMVFASYGNNGMSGYGYGLGAALVQGVDFKCNTAICYAIGPARHQQFQQLQMLLNLFAAPVGFASLVVDGFLGDKTVKAAQFTAKAIRASELPGSDAPSMAQISNGVSKDQLASLVNDFNLALAAAGPVLAAQRAQAGLPQSPVIAPSTPVPTTATTQAIVEKAAAATTAAAASGAAAALAQLKKPWVWWIAGGVAAVLLVGGVGFVYYRRKAPRAARF